MGLYPNYPLWVIWQHFLETASRFIKIAESYPNGANSHHLDFSKEALVILYQDNILSKKPLILPLFDCMLFARCFNVQ